MPRFAGYAERQHVAIPSVADYLRARMGNAKGKLTRQGVRDLNGPNASGRAYNGNRSVTCPHYRDPKFSTVREKRWRTVFRFGSRIEIEIDVYLCIGCGEERFTGDER